MGIHDGHRENLRKSFAEIGLEGKTEHQALELLLTYALPRIDVNPLAHELINRFGSLSGVMDADIEDLTQIKHISKNVAVLLKLVPQLAGMYHESKCRQKIRISTVEAFKRYMIPRLINEKNEVFYILCLDNHLNLVKTIRHAEGAPDKAAIDIKGLANTVLSSKASQVILVHNHLSGSVTPSVADIVSTNKITEVLKTLDITVIEHFIVSGDSCQGILRNIKTEN